MNDKLFRAALIAALAGLIVLLYFFEPTEGGIFPDCPTQSLLGIYCPGCGTLRALHALSHGHIAEAFSQNALAMIFLPLLPIMAFYPKPFARPWVPWAILAVFAIFTLLRNLSAFSFLAPH